MIQAIIFFANDPSVGWQSETFTMQIPDFREDFTETEEMLKKCTEQIRNDIKAVYDMMYGESYCTVKFSFELPEYDKSYYR